MPIPVSLRTLAVAAAAGWLLAAGHTPAQAPPPVPDYDKRLKALEDKMDRVLKLLEAREASRLATDDKALAATRDKLRVHLDAAQQRYTEFRRQNPFAFGINANRDVYAERLAKIETRRNELKFKLKELEERLSDIAKAYDGGKNHFAALRLLVGPKVAETTMAEAEKARDGVIAQLTGERRKLAAALGEKHSAVRDADDAIALARKTFAAAAEADVTAPLAALRAEARRTQETIEALDKLFDTEARQARELSAFETQDERLRGDVDRMRQALNDVEKQVGDGKGPGPR
jgi:DNA repair exonuclease SbcCD ATPase subunit